VLFDLSLLELSFFLFDDRVALFMGVFLLFEELLDDSDDFLFRDGVLLFLDGVFFDALVSCSMDD